MQSIHCDSVPESDLIEIPVVNVPSSLRHPKMHHLPHYFWTRPVTTETKIIHLKNKKTYHNNETKSRVAFKNMPILVFCTSVK